MSKLNFLGVTTVIGHRGKRKLMLFSMLRVMANILDIAGVAGIALLASAFGAFASGSGQAAEVSLPILGKVVIAETEAVMLAFAIAVLFVSKSVLSILLNLKTALFTASVESHLSNLLAKDFFALRKSSEIKGESVSDFLALAMSSTAGIKTYLNGRISLTSEGSLLVALLIVFLIVNPIATFGLALFVGGVLYVLNRLITSRLEKAAQESVRGSQMALQAARDLHGVKREAHMGGALPHWLKNFNEGRSKVAQSSALIYVLGTLPRYVIETALILGIFLFLGGVVVFSDIPSQAVAIGVFLAGGLRIMASVIPLQGALNDIRTGAASGQFAFDVLTEISSARERGTLFETSDNHNSSSITFENVTFSYGSPSGPVLRNVSFQVEPNTKVAIVGPSGAGKSTILDLSMGFLVPSQGKVLLGGIPTRDVLMAQPGTFATVPQRPNLVSGSIVRNVSLVSDAETDVKRVKEVLIHAGLAKLTKSRRWQDMEFKPDSGQLSGGEVQRLSLARALYRKPKLLFLDEATSALDAETEYELIKVLESLKDDLTLIVIAHRLSTVRSADKIIYLKDGEVVAEGTFTQLQEKVKDFARAVRISSVE